MPKVSRPVVYTALAAVAAYALVLNTQPDTATVRHTTQRVMTRTTQAADPSGVLPADLSAHFPRYTGGARDPFAPGVVLPRPKASAPSAATARALSAQTGWTLTGINSVNGVSSALIENAATGESVFLQPGDRWNGLRVVSIKPDRVLFQNALGHQDSLTFAQPPDEDSGKSGGPSVPALPALRLPTAAAPLPPYPVSPLPVTPLSESPSSLPALPTYDEGGQPPPDENAGPPGPPGPYGAAGAIGAAGGPAAVTLSMKIKKHPMKFAQVIILSLALAAVSPSAFAQFNGGGGYGGYGGAPAAPAPPPPLPWAKFALNPKVRVNLDFRNASVDAVLHMLSQASGVTIIKDPALSGGITLQSPRPLSLNDAFSILNAVLNLKNYELSSEGDFLLVRPRQQSAPRSAGGFGGFGGGFGGGGRRSQSQLRTYVLHYADATALARVINDVFATTANGPNAAAFPVTGGDTTGGNGNGGGGRLRRAARRARRGFGGGGSSTDATAGAVKASADAYSNSLIVNASSAQQDQIAGIIAQVDRPADNPQHAQVFKLAYALATDLQPVIQNILSGSSTLGRGASTTNTQQNRGGGGFGGFGGFFGRFGGFGGGGNNSANNANGTVTADARTNSLVVTATAANLPAGHHRDPDAGQAGDLPEQHVRLCDEERPRRRGGEPAQPVLRQPHHQRPDRRLADQPQFRVRHPVERHKRRRPGQPVVQHDPAQQHEQQRHGDIQPAEPDAPDDGAGRGRPHRQHPQPGRPGPAGPEH